MLDQRLGSLEFVAAHIRYRCGVHRRHTGVVERLQRVERARVMDAALQHNIIWILSFIQVKDHLVVVDPHILQTAPIHLLKQQLLLDPHARAEDADSHCKVPLLIANCKLNIMKKQSLTTICNIQFSIHSPQSSPTSGASASSGGFTRTTSSSTAQSGQVMISPSTTSAASVMVASHSGQLAFIGFLLNRL